jgi:pilus assembly protein CpaC
MIAASTTQFWRSRHRSRRPAAFFAALVVYIIVVLVASPVAQSPQAFAPANGANAPIRDAAVSGTEIDLLVGRSTVLNVGTTIARVSLTVPDVADAMVTAPTQLLIHGKTPGIISLFVWDKAGAIKTYEVNVRRDLTALNNHLKQLFPGESITVLGSGKDVVLSGTVASQYVVDKAAEVAGGYVEKKDNVVNLLKQQEGVASNQVMLRVRFAEVSRTALQELGVSLVANGSGTSNQWFGRTTPGIPGPEFDDGRLLFSDFLNIFVFNAKEQLGGVIRALHNKGLFQSLAEPNLIATNGKEASFLAGGEYPYPIIQPSGTGGNSVTIAFKEFGVRLNFTPTVLGGDLIHLKLRPEVSSLDFANAVLLEGFRIPALTTRRTETEVELRDGQTFAIAGLMNNTLTSSMSKIPGIGDIPILGLLFRSKAHQKNQTELVVMITPTIIRKGQMGVSEGLPSLVEPYLGRPDKTYPNPDAYTGSPRYPTNQKAPNDGNYNNSQTTPAPQPSSSSATVPSRPISQKPAEQPREVPTATVPMSAAPASKPSSGGPESPAQAPASMPQPAQPAPMTPAGMPGPAMPPSAMPMMPPSSSSPAESPSQPPMPPMPMQTSSQPQQADGPAPLTKEQQKAIEKAREQQRKAEEAEARERAAAEKREAEAEAKRKAEEQKRAEAEKRQADKLAKERAKREAEVARKNAELAKKKADEDQKRDKALAEAANRLKEAQAAYQAEVSKTKGGKGDQQ